MRYLAPLLNFTAIAMAVTPGTAGPTRYGIVLFDGFQALGMNTDLSILQLLTTTDRRVWSFGHIEHSSQRDKARTLHSSCN
jgi:hypothetical protein